jgi:hypothetical protein
MRSSNLIYDEKTGWYTIIIIDLLTGKSGTGHANARNWLGFLAKTAAIIKATQQAIKRLK